MKFRIAVGLCLVAALAIVAAGCPESFPKPPFDTTGTFVGVWNGATTDQAQQVVGCPLTLTLTQNVASGYPGDHVVSGVAEIDYSCIDLPDWIDEPLPTVVNVGGILEDHGKLTLLTGGCDTAICVVLSLSGFGEDVDTDGYMDDYTGTWAFTILLAGVEPFGVNGSFDVTFDS
ncbi:MAG: hypothetical protein AMXMBFR82_22410 [Candidatus Hydrogenedentota bacterium]